MKIQNAQIITEESINADLERVQADCACDKYNSECDC